MLILSSYGASCCLDSNGRRTCSIPLYSESSQNTGIVTKLSLTVEVALLPHFHDIRENIGGYCLHTVAGTPGKRTHVCFCTDSWDVDLETGEIVFPSPNKTGGLKTSADELAY
jgi:hypothetical protein